ncbi:MAG: glycosyltransferase [Bacteroidia bacterium]|nr:glycosyltransferase [Bacteroidia bacterium]
MDTVFMTLFWGVWTAYAYILWRWGRVRLKVFHDSQGRGFPSVSVLIPARNEALHLSACLESLLRQTHPPDEIIVIDDHSEDETHAIALRYASAKVRALRLLPGQEGKKAALRLGIETARGEVILTTDADTVHLPDTVEKMLRPFHCSGVQVVGGWIRFPPLENWLIEFQRIELSGVLVLTAGSWQQGEPLTANGALLAYRRSAFEKVMGWGAAGAHPSGDDDLLVQRICLAFGPQALVFSEAVVQTQPAFTWRALVQQRLRWLSKRHLYPAPWTKVGLGLLAGAQVCLVIATLYKPAQAIWAWAILSSLQAWIAWKGFSYTQSPPPKLKYWVVSALLYPFYQVVMLGWLLLRPGFEWKGRRYSESVAYLK